MDFVKDAGTNLFALGERDDDHSGVSGIIQGYLSIRYGYVQFHYSKEDWMTEEVSEEQLSAIFNELEKQTA